MREVFSSVPQKRKVDKGALEGEECYQTFLGFGKALHVLRP